MKIAVCEDVAEEAEWLCGVIRRWSLNVGVAVEISSYENAASFFFSLEDTVFDALFLDIKMPGEDGISLAKRLREKAYDTSIVFVTGEKEYVLEGYEVDAVNYLLKPVSEEKLFQCLDRICVKRNVQEPFILLKTEDSQIKILQREIYKVEIFGHRLVYSTVRGTFDVISTMKEAKSELRSDWFASCYRGILVNLLHVEIIGKNSVIIADKKNGFQEEVPVSRRLRTEVNDAFIRLYAKKTPKRQ